MAQCVNCRNIMKVGIPYRETPKSAIVWYCTKCWDMLFTEKERPKTVNEYE